MKRLFTHTFFQTLCALCLAFVFGKTMPLSLATFFYTISTLLKDVLMAFLPLAIFFFIASTLRQFEKRGLFLMITLVIFELISNASASFAAYGLSFLGASFYNGADIILDHGGNLHSFLTLKSLVPSFWRVEYGTVLGVLVGLTLPYLPRHPLCFVLENVLKKGRRTAIFLFSSVFSRVIPLFIVGFFIQLMRTTPFMEVLRSGGFALALMTLGIYAYILLLFWISAGFSFKGMLRSLKNAMPAGIVAFSSMSSAATMPITIAVTEKNLKQPSLAGMIIPATTNIQQVGDCFFQVFLCCVLVAFFGDGIPSLSSFFIFLSVFVLARFTTAGVVGGAVFIMIPIYQTYLGFNDNMISILLTLNMLFDPVVTSSNVMGNSALCVLFERVWGFVLKIMLSQQQPAKG